MQAAVLSNTAYRIFSLTRREHGCKSEQV